MRGWFPERGGCSQMGAKPLRLNSARLLLRALPLAPDLLQRKRNWRPWLCQAPGQGWTVPWGCRRRLKAALSKSLASPRGKPPIGLQLPTPRDGGNRGREAFNPESKLLGRGHRAGQGPWAPA